MKGEKCNLFEMKFRTGVLTMMVNKTYLFDFEPQSQPMHSKLNETAFSLRFANSPHSQLSHTDCE